MKKTTAQKLLGNEADLSSNTDRPAKLFVRKEENPGIAQDAVYISKRFRGDLVVYFIAVGLWLVGTIWLVVKLVDKFF